MSLSVENMEMVHSLLVAGVTHQIDGLRLSRLMSSGARELVQLLWNDRWIGAAGLSSVRLSTC